MRAAGWLSAVIIALLLTPVTAEARAGHHKGDHILFSGRVTGADSEPLGGITVLLELSRTTFSVRRFKQVKKNTLSIPVTTTVDGQYLHDWRWDGYYNTFELAVAVPAQKDGGFEILHRVDVTDRVRQGDLPAPNTAPEATQQGAATQGAGRRDFAVVTPLRVQSLGDLGWLRRLLGGRASAEEDRIFREMGQPDRVDAHDHEATAWWYFEAGKVYRFRAGALEQVEHFEPIKPQ